MNKILYVFVLFFLLPLELYAVSFSADAVQIRNGEFNHARMFWTDNKVRFEYLDQGVSMVQIYDTKNKKIIWLDTENKVFLERKLSRDQGKQKVVNKSSVIKNPCEFFKTARCTRLKEVTVNGRSTVKWLVTRTINDSDKHIFQWLDKKYGVVIKQKNHDGSFLNTTIDEGIDINGRKARKIDMYAISKSGQSMRNVQWHDSELNVVIRQVFSNGAMDELRNIKVEKISASLFTIPKGYSKVEQPVQEQSTPKSSDHASQLEALKFVETPNINSE